MATSKRLLVLALDAASPSLLRRWATDGRLPRIARLLDAGLVADTRSVDGFFVGATWPSFYMGCGPGHHGLYWLDRLLPGTYRIQKSTAEDLGRHPALWEVLSDAGRRVVVLDVPLTRLSPQLRGAQVREWGVHDEAFGFGTRPRSLRRTVLRQAGQHPVPASCDAPRRGPDEYRSFAEDLARGAALRADLTRHLLGDLSWDFAIQVFSEPHCAGHQLWHTHDPSHPAHTPGEEDLLLTVYQAVDRAVGEILNAVGNDTTVALLSLHSMGPTGGASVLLPDVLRALGVFHDGSLRGGTSDRAAGAEDDAGGFAGRLRAAYHRLPEAWRAPVYRLRQAVNQRLLARGSPLGFDPARTRAFPVGLGLGAPWSGIRLNLRGREPDGILEPGSETEAFVGELAAALDALTYPETGRRLVRGVHRTADLHPGPRVEELPDLLVEWEMDPPLGTTVAGDGGGAMCRVRSPDVGELERLNRYGRTGEHRPEGMLVLAGPGITSGSLDATLSIVDLAPTLAALLGCAMPDAQGRPVEDLLP